MLGGSRHGADLAAALTGGGGAAMNDDQYGAPRDSGNGILGCAILLVIFGGLGVIWAIEYVARKLLPFMM